MESNPTAELELEEALFETVNNPAVMRARVRRFAK
jgi:hypothetical protein